MHYDFPLITNISDVTPHIAGCKDFVVVQKDYGVTIINYVFQTADTFPPVDNLTAAVRRECRGLIFDTASGDIIRRSFHKFFNFGEKKETSVLDLSRSHSVVEKLDGSMITPLPLPDGTIRWASKMGITSVSMQAEEFIAKHPQYEELAKDACYNKATAIFEWCSRQQRIVVDYPEDQLVLLNIRDNKSGRYVNRNLLERISKLYNIPLVQQFLANVDDLDVFVKEMRANEDIEGSIILWDDGHMVKVKADAYVTLHRAKSMIERERDVVLLILNEKLDDLIPLLSEDDKAKLHKFSRQVGENLYTFEQEIYMELQNIDNDNESRKEFAQRSVDMHPSLRAAVFRLFDHGINGADVRGYIRNHIVKHCQSRAMYVKAKEIITAKWSLWDNGTEEESE